jgi:predicted nucleic acid-binding protein
MTGFGESLAVLDSSLALKWVLPETGREHALVILDAFESGSIQLMAPRLFLEEVASALSKRCRRKELTAHQAREAFAFLEKRRPLSPEPPVLITEALTLALQHQISLWDALYLALAIEYGCVLFTADKRFHTSASRHYPFVRLVA